jgi:asparagine synthase (glutamine-hydrolysing)
MCGVAGFEGEDQEKIARMVQELSHRGPDAQQWEVTGGASIGNARLAILDPRPEGNQPMWNDQHTIVITYNGEIFNFRELRKEHHLACRTGTDTEVLLKLYEKLGIGFVRKLRGMFAFGLYDTEDRTWYLARDGNGILPLFYTEAEDRLSFASELRTLLKILPNRPPINFRSLSRYMTLQYVPGPETMCEGIFQLHPGTILQRKDGKSTCTPFEPEPEPPVRPDQPGGQPLFRSREDFRKAFPTLMDKVVRDHLVSDRPLGIFLSGGVDSTVLLHHMNNHAQKPIKTFTVRFDVTKDEGEERFNQDANLAKKTAKHYGTDHMDLLFTAEECREVYRDCARSLDQPNADSVAMAQYVLAREAKKEVDVILCGAGGDELFGGYPRYRIARILNVLRRVPGRRILGLLPNIPGDIISMSPGPDLALRLLGRPEEENRSICKKWFSQDASKTLFEDRFAALPSPNPNPNPIRSLMEFDRHTWLPDESLRLADSVTMAHGLECRVPFLDPRIIHASLSTPAEWHVGWQVTKKLLKETYTPFLPPHFREIKKACFFPPLAKWIRRECAPLVEESLEHPRIRELFDTDLLLQLLADHKAHRKYALHPLSSIAQLSTWFEMVYEKH